MQPDIMNTCQETDTAAWKEIPVDYGMQILKVHVPPDCAIIGMEEIPFIPDPRFTRERCGKGPMIGDRILRPTVRLRRSPVFLVCCSSEAPPFVLIEWKTEPATPGL